MLEGRAQHDARIVVEGVLRAVAVVHVEVEDRDALRAMRLDRVHGADGDVVEDAEAHRARRRRVMPGRAHRAERGARLAVHHRVGGRHDGARRAQGRGKRACVHRRIRVEAGIAAPRGRFEDEVHVRGIVDALEVLARGERRLPDREARGEPRGFERGEYRLQPRGRLRVPRPHLMQDAIGVREERRGHPRIVSRTRCARCSCCPRMPGGYRRDRCSRARTGARCYR